MNQDYEIAVREQQPQYYIEPLPSAQVLANHVVLSGAVIGFGLFLLSRLFSFGNDPEPSIALDETEGELPEPDRVPDWTPKGRL